MNRRLDGWKDRRMAGGRGCIDGWMDECVNEQMDVWMDGRIEGWLEGEVG